MGIFGTILKPGKNDAAAKALTAAALSGDKSAVKETAGLVRGA